MGSVPDESVKPPQQAATGALEGPKKRLKREDCEFVKHDKVFSEWKLNLGRPRYDSTDLRNFGEDDDDEHGSGLYQLSEPCRSIGWTVASLGDKMLYDILVGPSDWKEHASGKEGAQRFRACNLPTGHVGPGVYELGVTAPAWLPAQGGNRTSFLRPRDVIVVYVGHADNICQRLQRYGQAGAHLEGSRSTRLFFAKNYMASNPQTVEDGRMSTDERPTRSLERCSSADTVRMSTDERRTSSARLVNSDERRTSIDEAWINMDFKQMGKDERRDASDGGRFSTDERRPNLAELMSPGPERERERGNRSMRGPRLFSEIFALGCSIAYRWAATDSKLVAERIESQLMLVFDYAWNRGNVRQRSPDILAKIVMGGAPGNKESSTYCFGNGSSRRRWFFFRRKRPGIWIPARRPEGIYGDRTNKVGDAFMLLGGRKGAKTSEFTMLDIPVERCGAILDSGLPCSALPVKGRKRCLMHKNAKRRSQRKPIRVAHTVQNTPPSQRNSSLPTIAPNPNLNPNSTTAREPGMFESCFPFLAPPGSKPPVSVPQEPKRRGSISFNTWLRTSELRKSKGTEWLAAMDEMNGIGGGIGIRPRHSTEGGKRSVTYQSTLSTWTEAQNEVPATRREICGLRLEDGTVCLVAPRPDRKRCFVHKGMRNSGLRSPIEIQSPNNMPLSST